MRSAFTLSLTVCSIYVLALAIAAILAGLEQIVPGMQCSVVFGVGVAVLGVPLAILHVIAVFSRNPSAAAVESFVFFTFFLFSLGTVVLYWPNVPRGLQPFDARDWAISIAIIVMNLLSALVMAAFSERCKTASTDQPQIRADAVGEAVLRIARKTELPPHIRNLRRASWFMVGLSGFFYIVGYDALRGYAVMGFIAGVIGISASYLIDRMDRHADLR